MFKKLLFVGAGGLLVLGLLFGRNLLPYASTAVSKAQAWADSQVDTSFKIDTARKSLKNSKKQIEDLVFEISKQEVAIDRYAERVIETDDEVARTHAHVMKLRDHLMSGDTVYVSTKGNFSNEQVKLNLSRSFRNLQQKEEELSHMRGTLSAMKSGLSADQENLETLIAKQTSLMTQIDKLEAEAKMLDAAEAASQRRTFDDSGLAQTERMIEEIQDRNDTRRAMMKYSPQLHQDSIPMEDDIDDDILDTVNRHLGLDVDSDVVTK